MKAEWSRGESKIYVRGSPMFYSCEQTRRVLVRLARNAFLYCIISLATVYS